MTTNRVTSREFNEDPDGAVRAAQTGPVYITDRGRPSYVLLTFETYKRLAASQTSITELLSDPPGIENVDIERPIARETAQPARFD